MRTGWVTRGSTRSVAISLFAVAMLTAGMAAASAQQAVEYGARAANRDGASESTLSYAHSVEPGITIVDAVRVVNFSNETSAFDIYARDMVATPDGTPSAEPRSMEPDHAGSWVTVDTPRISIGPRSSALVSFTLTAPKGTPSGTYGAAILVEPSVESAPTGISQRTRIALPLAIEVLGEVDLGVAVGPLTTERSADVISFEVPVTNTGNVSFSGQAITTVASWRGAVAAEIAMEPPQVFISPGDTIVFRGTWDDVPLFGRLTAQAAVSATVGERQPREFASDTVTLWIIPWAFVFTLAVITAIGIVTWHRTQPSRQEWREHRRRERELVDDYRRQRSGT